MELEIIAQIIGFIPLFLSYVIFYFNDRKKMLFTKMVADLLSTAHHILLGPEGYSGAAICLINVARSATFMKRSKTKLGEIIIPLVFITVTMASSVLTWAGPISLLPAIGSSLAVMGYWCANPATMRKFILPGVVLWLIYAIAIFSISGIISNCLSIISMVSTEIRCRKEQRKGV